MRKQKNNILQLGDWRFPCFIAITSRNRISMIILMYLASTLKNWEYHLSNQLIVPGATF